MFGNILGKLFSKTASNYGDDVLRGTASKYGSNIAANLGDDAGRSVLASLTSAPAKAGILSQLKNGVTLERPINASIAAGNDALTGATDLALRGGGV